MSASTAQTMALAEGGLNTERRGEQKVSRPAALALLDAEFDNYYASVYRYLLHRSFDRELAEELAAETFYKAATSVRSLRADRRELHMWLLRVATNIANAHLRKLRWRRLLFGRWAASIAAKTIGRPGAQSVVDQCRERVRAAMQALPPADQAVIALRYYTQLSYEDTAAILGCRTDAVRARLSRALKRLRQRLDSEG
ncbi:MAG TPA: RNA polymerase sigma factor [Phycisphaerae bacterium]|nr:RNA polymerase sigma factor [Phycisphaerae bacterium]